MGTQIYHGYKIYANSLDEVIDALNKPQKEIERLIKKEAYKVFLEKALDIYDTTIFGRTILKDEISFEGWKNYVKDDNLESSACSVAYRKDMEESKGMQEFEKEKKLINYIYPEKFLDSKKNKNYYLFTSHAQSETIKKYVENLESVEYYGYWDNSEREDGVSVAQWKRREEDWDKVLLSKSATPSMCGLGLTLASESCIYVNISDKELAQEIINEKSLKSRMKTTLGDIIVGKIMEQGYKGKEITSIHRAVMMFHDNEMDSNIIEYKKEKERLIELILEDFSYEDLLKPLEQKLIETESKLMNTLLNSELEDKPANKIKPKI